MRFPLPGLAALLLTIAAPLRAESTRLDPAEITATLKRVADWQLAHPTGIEIRDWVIAPFYDGLLDAAETTGDPKYLAAVLGFGIQSGWLPGNRLYHADYHAVGHAWLDIYAMNPERRERLRPFKARFDAILAKPITEDFPIHIPPKTPGVRGTDRWTWCDALYMAPPTLARLAKITGDDRYLKFLDAEYRHTYDALFDPAENLFYRDARFIGQKTPNGAKVFWSRGNGWVFGGLPLLLEALPTDYPNRKFYEELFVKMSRAILAAQQPDGLWVPSLHDPKQVAVGETSGSAFFVYGLAWGVRHGLLDKAAVWPAVERGWKALLTRIEPSGAVGFVQRIGDAPGALDAQSRQLYGTGGVLMAGSEILRTLGATAKADPVRLLAAAEKIVADDRTPRAYARFVPERQDDLAWENDKVAFRIYGPALRAGLEANGIDAWAKKIPSPVLTKWYADDLAGRQSYHSDHGEGFDGYHVGDTAGCGGTGIWHAGKLITPEVYEDAEIFWTAPDMAEFLANYTYPPIDGKTYRETRRVRLRLGDRLNEITSRFTLAEGKRPPAPDLEVAIGLVTQTPAAEFLLDPKTGTMALWDSLPPGKNDLGTAVLAPAGSQMIRHPLTGESKDHEEAIALVRTDAKGEITYRAGFAWAGDGEITSKEAWLEFLNPNPRKSIPPPHQKAPASQ